MSVYIGDVQTFAGVIADKPQVLKVIEESAEVFSAWERLRVFDSDEVKGRLVEEIADTIQACANLLAAIGVDDMRQPMQVCYVRNKERGREYASSDDMDSAVYVQKCPNESCRQYADQGERAELPDCESDSREKLEADVRDWTITTNAVFPENRVKSVKGFLDRQAAITHSIDAWNIKWLEDERESLQTQVDELQEQVNDLTIDRNNWRERFNKANSEKCDLQSRDTNQRHNNLLNRLREKGVVVNWDDSRSDYMVLLNNCDAARELQAENDGLKARIESLRTKLSKMLDAASEIQHIGDLP